MDFKDDGLRIKVYHAKKHEDNALEVNIVDHKGIVYSGKMYPCIENNNLNDVGFNHPLLEK